MYIYTLNPKPSTLYIYIDIHTHTHSTYLVLLEFLWVQRIVGVGLAVLNIGFRV